MQPSSALWGFLGGRDRDAAAAAMAKALCLTSPRQHLGNDSALGVAGVGDIASFANLSVAVFGRPRFGKADQDAAAGSSGPASTLARLFAEKGEAAFASLRGSFVAAVIDDDSGSAFVALDRMGTHSLTYAVSNGALVFSTAGAAVKAHPLVPSDIDPQAIYDYLYFHVIPAPATIFRGQRRLLPGEYLAFRQGALTTAGYWTMRFEETYRAPFAELREQFLATLRNAVAETAEGAVTGTFLSGGTDSSTMAGLLGEVTGKPARTYSIGFAEPGYDETGYARTAARHFATEHHEYYLTPDDVTSAIPLVAAAYDQPFGNSSAVPTYYCARLAKKDGIERLIGGDGGDELFGGNARYAKQYIFSLYERIPAPLRDGVLGPFARRAAGAEGNSLLSKASSYVRQASVPMPARLETYNLLERIGCERIFTEDFLRAIDRSAPLALLEDAYRRNGAKSLINRMLALDLRITLADNDLLKVVRMCAQAGVEAGFPLLADEVVAFSARLAPGLKLRRTRLRYFFKEALRGFLPEEIIGKQKHGFGMPFGPWFARHKPLQDIVVGSLEDLKRRGIVQNRFIDALTSQYMAEHSGYYGTLVWILMMLEQWLQQRGLAFQFSSHSS